MDRRWLALLVLLVASALAWLAWDRGLFGAPAAGAVELGPTAAMPRIEAIRALAVAPEAATRAADVTTVASAIPSDAAVDTLRCQVLGGDGRPRAGLPVFLLRARDALQSDVGELDPEKSEFVAEKRTSDNGRVEFSLATRDLAYVWTQVEKERVDARAWVGDAREIVLRFPRAIESGFEVVVVTEAGDPVPEYSLRFMRTRGNSTTDIGTHEVRSADGRFRGEIGTNLSKRESLLLNVIGPIEFEPASPSYTYDEVLSGAEHRIVLVEKTGGMRGIVVTSSGTPVEGARVAWAESREADGSIGATTDARGRFVFAATARRDRGFLFVGADGHAPFTSAIDEVPTSVERELRVELEPGAVLEGVVTTAGVPVQGAFVIAWIANSRPQGFGLTGSWFGSATTGADGRYRIEHLPRGALFVAVRAPEGKGPRIRRGFEQVKRLEILDLENRHDVLLETGIALRGSFDADMPANCALFLELYAVRDPSMPWSTSTCTNGEDFDIAVPRGSDAILRVWLNSNALFELPIPATNESLDLGEIEIERSQFRAPGPR